MPELHGQGGTRLDGPESHWVDSQMAGSLWPMDTEYGQVDKWLAKKGPTEEILCYRAKQIESEGAIEVKDGQMTKRNAVKASPKF